MPNDLPDWVTNASLPGQSLTLSSLNSTLAATLTLPTRAPGVVVDVLTSTFNQVSVTGHTSGEVYISQAVPVVGPIAAVVTDFRDTSVDISLAHTIGGLNDVADVSFIPTASIVLTSRGSSTDVTDRSTRTLGQVQGITNPVNVQVPGVPKAQAVDGNIQLAGATSTTIVPGVANQTIKLYAARIYTPDAAGAFGSFRDTNGTQVGAGTAAGVGPVFSMDYPGTALPGGAGVGLALRNFGGATSNYLYSLAFTQG